MKISILTSSYNRANLLDKLYQSLIINSKYEVEIEWLIMDDGSTDNTKEVIERIKKENMIKIKYFFQENQGKMKALNNLVEKATGELIIECDSDDYFTEDAFKIVKEEYEKNTKEGIYALCFLKYNQDGKNMGNNFINKKTTMFDLYFKEKENGEKSLVFYSDIRRKYKYELEKNERFITEARMYHKMDLNYRILCINKPIMICEYREDGYSKNILEQFRKNPYGYYEYFKEIFTHDMTKVSFSKRLYVIKHYILFKNLTNSKKSLKNVKGFTNKVLYLILYIPGTINTKMRF